VSLRAELPVAKATAAAKNAKLKEPQAKDAKLRDSKAKPAATRQRQPTEIRRSLIVEAARSVIAERGLFATTMRDIAREAGVSVGTLTYHFTGIGEILRDVLEGEMEQFYAPIAARSNASPDGAAALQILIDGFFASGKRAVQHWRLWLDFWSLSAHDATYAAWQRNTYLRWSADVEATLRLGCAQGAFAIGDIDLALTDFLAMFDGLAAQAYLPGSRMGPRQARTHLTNWVGRTLVGDHSPVPKHNIVPKDNIIPSSPDAAQRRTP
jgi:AcrR family transcriptional regulator